MHRNRPRSSAMLFFVFVLLLTAIGQPTRAQTNERINLTLTQMSPAGSELWPADINGDGITDLVMGPKVTTELGRGDGTFGGPRTLFTVGDVVGVGDVNGDGRIDVITTTNVLPGHGDAEGTFAIAVPLPSTLAAPVYVVDMDNDGKADLVTFTSIYRGHGDFTFDARVPLNPTPAPFDALTIADFNGDGLLDAAVTVPTITGPLRVFLNQGGLTFSRTDLSLPFKAGGLTARDVNGDGIVDLVAGGGQSVNIDYWATGSVFVMLGFGDGTFQPPTTYPVNPGPVMVVAGDFNGDGVQDIATGNISAQNRCDNIQNLWDSVSILLGRGDGTFAQAQSFALGDSQLPPDTTYRHSLSRLNTSDLNGDGRTDLLVSPGAILLMQPPGTNHVPIVDAGPDGFAVTAGFDDVILRGSATDADSDWLTFEWRDDLGNVVSDLPQACIGNVGSYRGTRVFTLTVTDGHGGVASDSMQLTFTGSTGPLPTGFSAANIGETTTAGVSYMPFGGPLVVASAGADIWDTADAFRYVYTPVSGDFDVSVRVASLENIDPWTKAGLMIRQSLQPFSSHASIFATPTSINGTAFQRRVFDGGDSTHTPGPNLTPALWLRLVRQGDTISAFAAPSRNDAWTLVGTDSLTNLADPVFVGTAVTSHSVDHPATATFDNYHYAALSGPPPQLPPGWEHADIGDVGTAGVSVGANGSFTVQGSGADIWNTSDAFQYAYTRLPLDGSITIHVAGLAGPDEWSKAGLMIRQSLSPSSRQHFLLVSKSHGLAYQRRITDGAETLHTELAAQSTPAWFRIDRAAGNLRLWYSLETATPTTWQLAADNVFFPSGEILIGLAVTSHLYGESATGAFDHVSATFGATSTVWGGRDIGAVGVRGSDALNDTVAGVSGSGADIWGTVDAFHYLSRTLPVNGSITARVTLNVAPNEWTKAGVMIRASFDPASPHAFMFLSRDYGPAFQRRPTLGAETAHTGGAAGGGPTWVRLTRSGNVVVAAYSDDGVTWVTVGTDVINLGDGPVPVGVAVTSHDATTLANATFDNITVTP